MIFKSFLAAGIIAVAATVSNAAVVSNVGTFAGGTDFASSNRGALVGYLHRYYTPNTAASEWVWDQNLAVPQLTFTHTFDMTGYDISTASLSGIWGVDNIGTAYLNGTAISSIPFGHGAFRKLRAYGANSGFVDGINTLSFVVKNRGNYDHSNNPGAFRAEAMIEASVAPVPLPAAGWLLLAGVGGMVTMHRRKAA